MSAGGPAIETAPSPALILAALASAWLDCVHGRIRDTDGCLGCWLLMREAARGVAGDLADAVRAVADRPRVATATELRAWAIREAARIADVGAECERERLRAGPERWAAAHREIARAMARARDRDDPEREDVDGGWQPQPTIQ